jgi:hypothetical protein
MMTIIFACLLVALLFASIPTAAQTQATGRRQAALAYRP